MRTWIITRRHFKTVTSPPDVTVEADYVLIDPKLGDLSFWTSHRLPPIEAGDDIPIAEPPNLIFSIVRTEYATCELKDSPKLDHNPGIIKSYDSSISW